MLTISTRDRSVDALFTTRVGAPPRAFPRVSSTSNLVSGSTTFFNSSSLGSTIQAPRMNLKSLRASLTAPKRVMPWESTGRQTYMDSLVASRQRRCPSSAKIARRHPDNEKCTDQDDIDGLAAFSGWRSSGCPLSTTTSSVSDGDWSPELSTTRPASLLTTTLTTSSA
eukprot:TRINITY_DN2397_c0_g1_i1.p1 TRINITY_DN2397_c0_g1~~TRINITY_DN2397_c0_g1_i1.p1  ORF type:complete len:168 (-),score=11.63 TRINITY_DN2397_c0_g1_i1:44-547(-)